MATKVFISYRRNGTKYQARMIYAAFCKAIPKDDVFMDVDSIRPGANFRKILKDWVNQCEVLLALIGPGWIDARDPKTKGRRLDSESDYVRIEIGEALARNIPVVPVLIDDAPMPDVYQLPDDLEGLVDRQAEFVEYRTFDADVKRLIKKLRLRGRVRPRSRRSSGDSSATPFYRRLDHNVTELDFALKLLASTDLTGKDPEEPQDRPFYELLLSKINRVQSATKPVCEARSELAELGDTAILEQLDNVCNVLHIGEDSAWFTAFVTAIVTAKMVVGLLETLHNDLALKIGSTSRSLK